MRQETIINQGKRFITIKEYGKRTGLSWATINHMCNSGQLHYITTESGLRKIDTMEPGADSKILLEKLDKTEKLMIALCNHLNVKA